MGRRSRYDFGGHMLMLAVLAAFFVLVVLPWLYAELSRGPRISQPDGQMARP